MAGKGPAPTPTAKLKLHNSKRAKYDRHDDEPKPKLGTPRCPKWLDKEARAEWRRVAPELTRMGVLAQIERGALTGYCTAWSDFRACREAVERDGRTILQVTGVVEDEVVGKIASNPEMKHMKDARLDMLRFAQDLGLTPASRTRVHAKPVEQPKTGVGKFFGGDPVEEVEKAG